VLPRLQRPAQLSERQGAVAERIIVKARRAGLSGVEPDWDECA
jgi:hypothetical protein